MAPVEEALRFDPAAGTVVREPAGTGYGFWAGGHKVSYDHTTGWYVLFYRLRAPLELGRGGVCRVAVGHDGIHFDDVWEATKEQLVAHSIEAGHCVRHDDREWRLYISYEYAGPAPHWRVDVLRGPSPSELEIQSRRTVLLPFDYGLRSLKDPWVIRTDSGGYRVYVCGDAPGRAERDGDTVRARAMDASLVAESDDGLVFPSVRYVYVAPADDSWHGRRGRVNGLFRWGDGWAGAFDGGRTHYDNFEEQCGLVTSADGLTIDRVETESPWVMSPNASGCVRYAWGLRVGQRLHWYYEFTRPDGAHDLRTAQVDIPEGM